MGILKTLCGDRPIGRALRDLKAGEVIEVRIVGTVLESDDIEFANPNDIMALTLQNSLIKDKVEYAKPSPATRGESMLAPVLRVLDQLAEYELAETLCPAAIRLTLAAFIRLPKQYPIQDQFKNPLCIMLDVVLGG